LSDKRESLLARISASPACDVFEAIEFFRLIYSLIGIY
jgi:hypothetical protein